MKNRFTALLAMLLVACTLALPTAMARPVDGIVAVVGDDVILASELADAVANAKAQLGSRADRIPANTLRSNVLDQLILTRLQVNRAKQRGLSVSDDDVDQGIARLAQQNKMSPNQFIQALEQHGVSLAAIRKRVKSQILIGKVRKAEVMDKVTVTDEDVTQFLQSRSLREKTNREYHILHIRINVPVTANPKMVENLKQQTEDLREQIVAGETSFKAAAEKQSDGDDAGRGGDMGWIGNAVMPQVFTDIVPQLREGEISEVFRGNGAFHLVKLLGVRGSKNRVDDQKVMVDEVKVQHITLKPNALRGDKRTHELAVGLKQRLAAGASFASLARQYSDDKATANQGGDLGWVQSGMLGSHEAVQVSQMSPGDVSPILNTDDGYAIIKLEGRRQVDKTREAIRRKARQVIGQRKSAEKGRLWLRELRDDAYVDIRLPGYERSGG